MDPPATGGSGEIARAMNAFPRDDSGSRRPVLARAAHRLPAEARIEKNLASLGFFTPSSKRIRSAKKKTISFTREADGKKVEVRATILPTAEYGLPITADQDKYMALQKIIADIKDRSGEVTNPIGFSSAGLLRILGKRVAAGKNYGDIAEWLQRLTLTGINSEGVVYFAGRRIWASDIFHVFERSVSFGAEMPDGSIAERNYVWLSQWQLENINNNHLLPIDLDAYRQLKSHIAKTIVPLLQIWLAITREEGRFEKPYNELCQILNINQYPHFSKIHEKLAPSLNELKACGYLASWTIEKDPDGCYKVVFYHGEKFRDATQNLPPAREERRRDALIAELLKRSVTPRRAWAIADQALKSGKIAAQMEWGDAIVQSTALDKRGEIYYCLIKENLSPPAEFEAARRSVMRTAGSESERLRTDYDAYVHGAIQNYLQARFSASGLRRRIDLRKTALKSRYPALAALRAETLRDLAYASICAETEGKTSVLPYEEFSAMVRVKSQAATV